MTTHTHPEVKRIGDTGQVSVGKSLAGKLVRVEPRDDGVMLRFVVDVAESDAWWMHEPYKSKLKEALAWAKDNAPAASDVDALLARVKVSPKKSAPRGRKKASRVAKKK